MYVGMGQTTDDGTQDSGWQPFILWASIGLAVAVVWLGFEYQRGK